MTISCPAVGVSAIQMPQPGSNQGIHDHHRGPAYLHPFIAKYAAGATVRLELADGVEVVMPLSREAIGLTQAELYQATDRPQWSISIVEQLEPTFTAGISLAELYSDAQKRPQLDTTL